MTSSRTSGLPDRAVLVVDDSGYARLRLRRFLLQQGFGHVFEAADGDEAMALFTRHHPRVVLLDQIMRGREGLETARLLLASDPDVQIIMLTAVTDRSLHEAALKTGIQRVLPKMDLEALGAALRELGHE